MRTTGVTELKASLSEMLARVKSGEEILITEHGRPIARLMPLPSWDMDVATEELVRRGLAKPPARPLDVDEFFKLPRPEDPEGLALKALLEERRSGW
ncbi:MAG TPA: type II toxin-antitoxin system prevent-host-death family antitoxin [Thermoanaerobaculia bacterium]|nr:type II toxin-antitoxin system prevent-host-death family antitoxin [Thermoanaerobaculia bacterium]